jgi:hypothetical protein
MGHVCDLLDVDPRNGGASSAAALKAAGAWPRSHGRAATPSGGTHDLIAPLHAGSRDAVAPGLDVKGGRPDGSGRGFAFIAPTRKRSKVTGHLGPYRWLEEPDLSELEADDTGTALAELVNAARPAPAPPPAHAAPAAGGDHVRARVDQLAGELARAPEGSGNNEATRIGFLVGQYVGAAQIPFETARSALEAALATWTWRDDASRAGVHMSLQRALEDGAKTPRPWTEPVDRGAAQVADLEALVPGWRAAGPAAGAAGQPAPWKAELDVTNPATAAQWLRHEAGRGRLSGMFLRREAAVHTPREGEDGYIPLTPGAGDTDGPAQVRPIREATLAARITYTYGCYRMVKRGEDWEPIPALFPSSAARTAIEVPDLLPHLRTLRGVIHSPVPRADGTLLTDPGYDPATGLLHLPEPGLIVPPVPERPDPGQVATALGLLQAMVAGFPFLSEHHRANHLGALLTPLLRDVAPPPYKLHAIEAHQPSSGKTLLANLSRWIHGGVFRAEVPDEDAELRKQITSILSVTTGPIVVLDNITGTLKSSTIAGLLTSARWDDRPLGSTAWTACLNDRLWTVTGNNLAIGGDMPRRTLRTVIDPAMPNPELRTGFDIPDLEGWVKQHRGHLLHALLVIIRSWVLAGMPLAPERTSDGYARWVRTIGGILTHAGLGGEFDHHSTQVTLSNEDDEWETFLAAIHRAYGTRSWSARELLADVDTGSLIAPGLIPADSLPGDLAAKAAGHNGHLVGIARSLTWWLRNREGRWAGGMTVRPAGTDANKVKQWVIHTMSDRSRP